MTCPISIAASNSNMQALLLSELLSDAFSLVSGLLPVDLKIISLSLYISTILKYFELKCQKFWTAPGNDKENRTLVEHLNGYFIRKSDFTLRPKAHFSAMSMWLFRYKKLQDNLNSRFRMQYITEIRESSKICCVIFLIGH